MDQPLIINLALTGAVADAGKNPSVPITPIAIIEDIKSCAVEGASIAHVHVRNPDGTPSCDPSKFAAIFSEIRGSADCPDIVLCASTSGRHGQTIEDRSAVLRLPPDARPDMASLTLGSLNFITGASINAPDTIRRLVDLMNETGVKPELEIFDLGMIEFAKVLIGEGRLQPPYYFNFLLGNIGGLQATMQHVGFALSNLPPDSIVSLAGIGKFQGGATALGAVGCDGVRTGLEDNLWADQRTKEPATNQMLTRRIADVCKLLGRPVSTAAQSRSRLGLVSHSL